MPSKSNAQSSTKKPKTKKTVSAKDILRLRSVGFQAGNPWRFKKGQSGNPGGKPKLIGDAYRDMLEHADANGVTNAAKIAMTQGIRAIELFDTTAAREIRQATEGELIRTFAKMTDAELDTYIAERERRIRTSPGGTGEARADAGDESKVDA